jgi:hypothetical protein
MNSSRYFTYVARATPPAESGLCVALQDGTIGKFPMDLTNQKILVTGADGFIGSHLVETQATIREEVLMVTKPVTTGGSGMIIAI